MKKVSILLVVLIGVAALLYGIWIQNPEARNTEVIAEAYTSTNERLKEKQAQAEDPNLNGYLNPTFIVYWGRKSTEFKDGSPASKIVEAWGKYSTFHQGEKVDHEALQAQGDGDYSKALADMEGIAPELRDAMNKPLFMPPKFELNTESESANFIAARACAQVMVGLAEAEVAQHKDEQAAQDLVSVINFGKGFYGQGTLIGDMLGVAIQAIGRDGFDGLIDFNSDISAEAWKSYTRSILDSVPSEDETLQALQGEVVYCGNSVDLLDKNPGALEGDSWLSVLPGYLSREKRVYNNLMGDLIVQYQKDGTLKLPKELTEPQAMDRFTGLTGPLVELLVTSWERPDGHLKVARKSLLALATATGVAAYRAQDGRLPENLDQLSEAGIPVTENKELLQSMEYEVHGDNATLKVKIQDPFAKLTLAGPDDWERPWLEDSDQLLTYKFGPTP